MRNTDTITKTNTPAAHVHVSGLTIVTNDSANERTNERTSGRDSPSTSPPLTSSGSVSASPKSVLQPPPSPEFFLPPPFLHPPPGAWPRPVPVPGTHRRPLPRLAPSTRRRCAVPTDGPVMNSVPSSPSPSPSENNSERRQDYSANARSYDSRRKCVCTCCA